MPADRPTRKKTWMRAACAALGLLLLPASCSKKDRSAEVRDLIGQYSARVQAFAGRIDRAADPAAAAAAMADLTAALRELAPKIKALGKTHPELGRPAAVPANLKPLLDGMDETQNRLLAAMGKAMRYGDDPRVQAARAGFEEIRKILE